MANQLANETSPYLLQHKDNLVDWRPWSPEVLAEAQRSNRPVLVSVGYAACHWCHVMAHESFEDAETAVLMNELFVCVKVDREERPDIDNWLQRIPVLMGQSGGWPLNVFLTPKGEPFWAGTYFPREAAFGRPSFKTVLHDISRRFQESPDMIAPNVRKIADSFEQAWYQNRSGSFDMYKLDRVAIAVAQGFDMFYGGMIGAPKFPNVPLIEALWRAYLRTGMQQYLTQVLCALDNMGRGGIFDQIGGGFSRYSVDEQWLVPHFEKMLYDNAQLIDIMTLVWQDGKQNVLKMRVEETIAWTLREMMVESAAFASSLDADSEGEEGKFYVWTEEEIDSLLAGTRVERFKQAYGITRDGNFPHEGKASGRNILHRVMNLSGWTEAEEPAFTRQRQILLAAREKRVRPGRDDKVLTDWNGLMIASLANAGAAFERSDWISAAKRAFDFICTKLGEGDRLFHSYRAGQRQHQAFSDGYAFMARAALSLWEATGERAFLDRARAWTDLLDREFWDVIQGGYVFSRNDDVPDQSRLRTAFDTQTPSANAVMMGVHARLFYATLNQHHADRANNLIQAFAGDIGSNYLQMGTYLDNFEFCTSCLEVIICGPAADPRTRNLIKAVLGRSLPNRLLMTVPPGQDLPQGHPAHGKTMQDGKPTAYICGGMSCSPPVTDPAVVSQVLKLPENSPMAKSAGNA